jgi:hypothetical protein
VLERNGQFVGCPTVPHLPHQWNIKQPILQNLPAFQNALVRCKKFNLIKKLKNNLFYFYQTFFGIVEPLRDVLNFLQPWFKS